jgi:hypothetical protein
LSETKAWLVTKTLQPSGAYRQQMHDRDSRPIESEVLLEEPGRVIEVVELTEAEVEDRRSDARLHILSVEPNYTARAPEPEVVANAAEKLDPEEIRDLVGFTRAYANSGTGRGRKVAVIDTGCSEATLRELGARIVDTKSRVSGEGPVNPQDSHGDWCIQQIAYLLPDAEFVVIKGLSYGSGSGSYSGIIACLSDARAYACTEANLSLGGPKAQAMNDAVNAADEAGMLVGVAAGNEQRGKTSYVADTTSPASAERALTVAAAQSDLLVADFSNWGTSVDVSAPGVYTKAPNVERYWSGTSMACPVLVAACAAIGSAGKTKAEVKQLVLSRARDTGEPAHEEGQGFVDLEAVFVALEPEPTPEPSPEPVEVSISQLFRYSKRYAGRRLYLKSKHGFGWRCDPVE